MFRSKEGFSLIELLIVVAMIAILAAVALPHLASFTFNSYNAAAAADCRSAAISEKAFYSDWGVYASSAYGGAPGAGTGLTSSANSTGQIWQYGISPTAPAATVPAPGFQIHVSQYVGIVINTSAMGGSFTIIAKNASGDRCFGLDSDAPEMYWVNGSLGSPMSIMGTGPLASAGVIDYTGVAGSSPCDGLGGGMGRVTWMSF